MNIGMGAKRLAYFVLALIWALVLVVACVVGGAFQFGEAVAGLLLFSLVYMIVGAGVAWVYRGFFGGKPEAGR